MQDGRLSQPTADDLDIDRHSFLACAESHRDARQPGNVERHGRALKVGGVNLLSIDDKFRDAMLVSRNRQHRSDQRVVLLEVLRVAVP